MHGICTLTLAILSSAAIPQDVIGANQRATPPDPVAEVQLTIVSFRRSVVGSELPINFDEIKKTMEQVAGGARHDEKGRLLTTGLGAQEALQDFKVEAGGFRLHYAGTVLTSTRLPDAAADADPPWSILTAPRMVIRAGQDASLQVGATVPYMVAREDGCLVVERSEEIREGADIKLKLAFARPDAVRFSEIRLRVSRVSGRQPLPNVPFEVGRPIIDSRETSLGMTVDAGRVAIIPLPQGREEDPILVFLTARAAETSP